MHSRRKRPPQSKPVPFELDAGLIDVGFTSPWHVQSLGSVLCGACVNAHGMSPVGLASTRHPFAAVFSGQGLGKLDNAQAYA